MTVALFLTDRCSRAGFTTVAAFHRALLRGGLHVSYSSVHSWLRGITTPTSEHIKLIARILDLPADERLQLHELRAA